ncbi:MAG: hypothetical protein LUH00_03080 [Lachnospiraceae bacterium]|nr:hypothetical protein [Lachnospiraceae bacterium]
MSFPDFYDKEEYPWPSSIPGKTIYEALAAMITKKSNHLCKGKSPDLPDKGFPLTTIYDIGNIIYFEYHLDKQGRVCDGKAPDAFLTIGLLFVVEGGYEEEMIDDTSDINHYSSSDLATLLEEAGEDYGPIYDSENFSDEYEDEDPYDYI